MKTERHIKVRRLTVGEETKDVKPGSILAGGEESVERYEVKEVKETGELVVDCYDLISGEVKFTAPVLKGISVTIKESGTE